MSSSKSPINSLSLPSIKASLIGCLTFILTSSRAFLPSEIKFLTKSILFSILSFTSDKSHFGKSLK